MFTPLPGRTSLGVGPERVVAVIESINAPNISIPETGTAPTKGYLIGVAMPNGGYGVICYLLQVESNRPTMFISNPAEVAIEQYPALEADAIQFAESMGFMLDNMNFRAQPPAAQAALVEQLPFFHEPSPPRKKTQPGALDVGSSVDAGAIGRLLSSF